MGNVFSTLARTLILDDAAYQEWGERPNLFLRGIVLIIVVSLVAGLVAFAVNLVDRVKPVDVDNIEEGIRERFERQMRWNPFFDTMEPKALEIAEDMFDSIVPMVTDLAEIQAPLPRGISGFFEAFGGWLSRTLSAIALWLFYGALVLVFVNVLGGSAKLGDFLGMASLYMIPGLLGLLSPIPCFGPLLVLAGIIWGIVVYVKAVSVASDMEIARSLLAVVAPFFFLVLLGVLLALAFTVWLALLF